jgi:hypothetical protein
MTHFDEVLGFKEESKKTNYEIDFEFIQQLAERMNENKFKYQPYNWQKPIEIEKLKQSLFRHVVEIMKGNFKDEDREFGHLEAIALNSMFINYQLKNIKQNDNE